MQILRLKSRFDLGWMLLGAALFVLVGCDREKQPALLGSPRPGAIPKLSPDESYREIVTTFRRAVADKPDGFVSTHEGAFSRLQFNRQVDDELIPPTSDDDTYRARITVTTRFSYSYRPPMDANDNNAVEEKPGDALTDLGGSLDIGNPARDPLAVLEPELTDPVKEGHKGGLLPKSALTTLDDEEVKTYDLAYEDGHWVLKTEPDLRTDQLISEAFKFALRFQ